MADQTESNAGAYDDIIGLDRVIHEPARLVILAVLVAADADFLFLLRQTGLTRGNLSSHLSKLEQSGFIVVDKSFNGKVPRTVCRLTPAGLDAFKNYRAMLSRAIDNLPG